MNFVFSPIGDLYANVELYQAAELGKLLLEQNAALQLDKTQQFEKPLNLPSSTSEPSEVIDHAACKESISNLNTQVAYSEATIDALRDEKESLISRHTQEIKACQREIATLQQALQEKVRDVEELKLKEIVLETDKSRLEQENQSIAQSRKKLVVGEKEEIQFLTEHVNQLEIDLRSTQEQRDASLDALLEQTALSEQLQERIQMLESQFDDFVHIRAELEMANTANEDLSARLENAQTKIQELQAQTQDNPDESPLPMEGAEPCRTLLSEVDDQRRSIEVEHALLQRSNMMLTKRYQADMERMKRQITRLSSLASDRSSGDRTRRLELALAQAQTESRELTVRIAQLESEREMVQAGEVEIGQSNSEEPIPSDFVSQRALRLRIDQLEAEIRALKKQLQTIHLVRANETTKLRSVENELYQRDATINKLQTSMTQLRWKIEEFEQKCTCFTVDASERNTILPTDRSRPPAEFSKEPAATVLKDPIYQLSHDKLSDSMMGSPLNPKFFLPEPDTVTQDRTHPSMSPCCIPPMENDATSPVNPSSPKFGFDDPSCNRRSHSPTLDRVRKRVPTPHVIRNQQYPEPPYTPSPNSISPGQAVSSPKKLRPELSKLPQMQRSPIPVQRATKVVVLPSANASQAEDSNGTDCAQQ
jgi:DNA repair exonuclease SbcCD ATPase subunit